MRRGIRDDASCFKGLGHDFAPTAVAVVNQPLSTENDAPSRVALNPKTTSFYDGMRRLSFAVAAKLRLSLSVRPSHDLLRCYHRLRMRRPSGKCACVVWLRGAEAEGSLSPLNFKSKLCTWYTRLQMTALTLRWTPSPAGAPEPAVLKSGVRTPRETHEPHPEHHDPYTLVRLDIRVSSQTLRKCQGRTARSSRRPCIQKNADNGAF